MTVFIAEINPNNCRQISGKCRRKFTYVEDETLKYLIFEIGLQNWVKIAEYMPGRTAKQCRDRFCNYLSEPHRLGPWEKEEDDILLSILSMIGPKWVEISKHIPGRSGNDVKNRWHKHLCKKYPSLKEKYFLPFSKKEEEKVSLPIEKSPIEINSNYESYKKQYSIAALLV